MCNVHVLQIITRNKNKKPKYFDPNRTLCFCFKIVYMDFMVKTAAEHAASFVRTKYAIKLRAPVWKDV